MEKGHVIPIYQKIALDIANHISEGEYKEGQLLKGRSALAAKYKVSPETIRRAIKILEDVAVVESYKGKGVSIISTKRATSFLFKHESIANISKCKYDIERLVDKKRIIEQELIDTVGTFMDYSSRLTKINPIPVVEVEVPKCSKYIGKTVGEIHFWQHTGATIVGIRREEQLILSPGPYITLQPEDILFIVGKENIAEAVLLFLNE